MKKEIGMYQINASNKFVSLVVGFCVVAGLSGCQGINSDLTSMNSDLAKVNADLTPSSNAPIIDAGAPVSPSMAQTASNIVMQSAHTEGNQSLQDAVQQAQPAINAVLTAWMSGRDCSGVEMYTSPGNNACISWLTPGWPYNAPHNVALSLRTVGDWRVITANSFSFVANFCSTVSQTCVSISPTFINMGQGWQIKRITAG